MASRLGKIPTTSVRRRISRLRRSLGLLLQIWRQISLGNAVNARMSARAPSRCSATAGSLSCQPVQDPVELGVDGLGVGLVVHRVQQRLDPPPLGLGGDRHEVRGVVGAAPLPRRGGQGRPDRVDQAGVGIGGDQRDPGQARATRSRKNPNQPAPDSAVATADPEDLAVPVGVDAGGDHDRNLDDPTALADLDRQRVRGHEQVRAGSVQRAGAERATCSSRSLAIR
jgi:hypothetical protein